MVDLLRTALISAMVVIGSASTVHAQAAAGGGASAAHDAEARALFEAGRVAFSDGRFEDALSHFQRSYDLSGRADLLYNIGTSQDRLRHEAEAVAAFERYLELVPDAENRREVEGRLRVLREELAREAELEARIERTEPTDAPMVASRPEEPATERDRGGEDVLASWWLWTIIGVVVAGAVTGGVLAATVQQQDIYPEYMRGTGDAIAITLTVPMP
ncbi:MAG: tetratricopeptide repeat protein [Myxococcota bacterium]|nr:tetratricopeptide repeat protein [Myxococcota bacterium]